MDASTLRLSIKVLLRRKFFTFVSLFGIAFTLIVLTIVTAMLNGLLRPAAPEVHLDRMLLLNHVNIRNEDSDYGGSPGYLYIERFARDLPGVEAMSVFSTPIDVVSFRAGQKIVSDLRRCDGKYWQILQFEFLEGGPFSEADVASAQPLIVISESTREQFFDGQNAVGRPLKLGDRSYEVIGVVRDVDFTRRSALADVWAPLSTAPTEAWRTQLRGGFEAMYLAESSQQFASIQRELDARLAQATPEMLGGDFDTTVARLLRRIDEIAQETIVSRESKDAARRFFLVLIGAALLFMLLPAMNLINVNLSRIFERSSEIGVRKAFGASSRDLVAQFVLENIVLCLIGGLFGFAGAQLALSWINQTQLIPSARFGLDPLVFVIGLALATLFGVLSGLYPAWRMSRLHPVQALKGETR